MRKTHFSIDPANSTDVACRRTVSDHAQTPFVQRVTCGTCKRSPQFIAAEIDDNIRRHERFMAQEPRKFGEPWKDGIITCECGHQLFRYKGRSCYGHYDDFVCAACGKEQSRLTETGMSF